MDSNLKDDRRQTALILPLLPDFAWHQNVL